MSALVTFGAGSSLVEGPVLGPRVCWASSLASAYKMPGAALFTQLSQPEMSPDIATCPLRGGSSWLSTTGLDEGPKGRSLHLYPPAFSRQWRWGLTSQFPL